MVVNIKIGNFDKNYHPDRLEKLPAKLFARIEIESDLVSDPIGDEKNRRIGKQTEPAQNQLRTQPNAFERKPSEKFTGKGSHFPFIGLFRWSVDYPFFRYRFYRFSSEPSACDGR